MCIKEASELCDLGDIQLGSLIGKFGCYALKRGPRPVVATIATIQL